ncbi:MAG: dihydrodipicolinate synthase family protein [Acidimicrobiia bacterium]|nr:MAG: dihydrodipicolinate synthase family protein [Acidimicrobiia bacterium]
MPALITAFDSNENIDADAHGHNVSVAVAAGADGVLLAGSTGEGPYLESGERKLLSSITRDAFPDLTILCGIFAETDRSTESQIAEAADGCANAVLIVTPGTLVRNRHHIITAFYRRIADSSPLPMFLYTVPRVTGYEFPVESVAELASHSNIVGIKDSGGDVSRLTALAETLNAGFTAYTGNSKALADSGGRGAFGAITASANYAFTLVESAASGDEGAQAILVEITNIVEQFGVSGTKFAASLAGLRPGVSRLPLQPLDSEAEQSITNAYEHMLSRVSRDT